MTTKSKRKPIPLILSALVFVLIAAALILAGCDKNPKDDEQGGDEKSIEMLILASDKTAYKVGDTLDTGTVEIMAIWSDGDISYIEPEDGKFAFSAGDSETLTFTERGKVTVTFVYGELTSYEMFVYVGDPYKFEAENAELAAGDRYPKVVSETDGVIQVGDFSGNWEATALFRITAKEASNVMLTACVDACNPDEIEKPFTDLFYVNVNGKAFPSGAKVAANDGWGSFDSYDIGTIKLREGENTVEFVAHEAQAGNIDYIELVSAVELGWQTVSDFGTLQVDAVELETGASTPIMRTFSDERFKNSVLDFEFDGAETSAVTSDTDTPYIRTIANEYIEITVKASKTASVGGTSVTYTVKGLKTGTVTVTAKTPQHSKAFTVTVEDPVLTRETYKFEAENAELIGAAKYPSINAEANGIIQVGGLDSNIGSAILFRINAEKADSAAVLRANVDCEYQDWAKLFTDRFTVTVNGVEISSSAAIEVGDGWGSFVKFDLGAIALKKGENEVKFALKAACGANFDEIEIDSRDALSWQTGSNFGTLQVDDVELETGASTPIARTFSDERFTNSVLDFEFDGATADAVTSNESYKYIRVIKNDTIEITISANVGGVSYSVRGLKAGTVTVTAKTPQHSKTFTITVTEGA